MTAPADRPRTVEEVHAQIIACDCTWLPAPPRECQTLTALREVEAAAKQKSRKITCECGRGPYEVIEHQDATGVSGWTLATHCSECLAAPSEGERPHD